MVVWNPDTYLRFARERSQPSIDLLARLRHLEPEIVYDLGCGPGNSTTLVVEAFPSALVTGLDNSPEMIAQAREKHPELSFELCDLHDTPWGADLLFSNACLQWVEDHERLIPALMDKLKDGGCLAAQMPRNAQEPFFRIIDEVSALPAWNLHELAAQHDNTLSTDEYYDILSSCSSDFDVWETVYSHALPSHDDLLEWVRGSRLRPYLQALSTEEDRSRLCEEILARAREEIPTQKDGSVILHFRRVFLRAMR